MDDIKFSSASNMLFHKDGACTIKDLECSTKLIEKIKVVENNPESIVRQHGEYDEDLDGELISVGSMLFGDDEAYY